MTFADPTQDTSDDVLQSLCRQIGQYLSGAPGQEQTAKIGLAESFAIWRLDPEHFDSESPVMPAQATDRRHYQLYLDRKLRGYAVVSQAAGDLKVLEIILSSLAKKIDAAIEQVDKDYKEDTPVRFLVAPSCRVYAFLIAALKKVYVIAAPVPPHDLSNGKLLNPGMIIPQNEFLDRLKSLYTALYKRGSGKSKDDKITRE